MSSPPKLVYIMDPMCSWCWGFAPVMDALVEQATAAGVSLRLVAGGLRQESQPMDASSRQRIQGYWQTVTQATGQTFDHLGGLPEGLIYDTEPACRALVAARAVDDALVWPLVRRIHQAFYMERQNVTQARVLLALAQEVGLDGPTFAEQFDGALVREQTLQDFQWAAGLGIEGFPTVLLESAGPLQLLTNGYQPLVQLAPRLQHWLERVGA